jgi:hemoglobin
MDIATTADVALLVDRFYGKVRVDALLGPIFSDVVQDDWPAHMATLYSFWETMLLGTGTYKGAPYPKHAVLPVEKGHFDRWLELFLATVDELFAGPKAEPLIRLPSTVRTPLFFRTTKENDFGNFGSPLFTKCMIKTRLSSSNFSILSSSSRTTTSDVSRGDEKSTRAIDGLSSRPTRMSTEYPPPENVTDSVA